MGKQKEMMEDPELEKGEDEGEDEESESEGYGDEDAEEEMEKSLLALDALEKGLATLETAGKCELTRKDQLLEKARKSDLDPKERKELSAILEGNEFQKSLEQEDQLMKAIDVSPALDVLASKMGEAIDLINSRLEKSMGDLGEFNSALADTLSAMGEVLSSQQRQIKILGDKLEKSLDMPARAPKALTAAPTREAPGKPTPAQTPAFNRRELAMTLEKMHIDSIQKGFGGTTTSGVVIKTEMAKLASGLNPDPQILRDAAEFTKVR